MTQKIFALSGTFGSGKGTVTDYLVKKYNFTHLSVTAFLSNEIKKNLIIYMFGNPTFLCGVFSCFFIFVWHYGVKS